MSNKIGQFYVDTFTMHHEVTGSHILCVVKSPYFDSPVRFVIDLGMFQEQKYLYGNKKLLFETSELDFACITHAHVDHVGRLPLISQKGFENPIYCSEKTSELLPLALPDCLKVLTQTSKRSHEKRLYSEEDVAFSLKLIQGVAFGKSININDFIKVTFFENGHLYGASIILVQISSPTGESINLLFTGDYSPNNVFFAVHKLPQWVRALPLNVVIESTYGMMTTKDINNCFIENVFQAIHKKQDIIIPAFSLGRGQEMLLLLKQLQVQGLLSPTIPIYYCGKLGIRYTKEVFLRNKDFFPETREFLPENLIFIDKGNKQAPFVDGRQKIIVGSSGMGTYGPMQTLLPYFLQKNSLIHFTGYCAEGTLGRKLIDADSHTPLLVSGILANKIAVVKSTNEFSAHAKSNELIDFLKQFDNLQSVLVNHGSTESKNIFASKVSNLTNAKNVAILSQDIGFRINNWGIQKSLNNHFI